MKNRIAVSLVAVAMLASSAAFAQSTTEQGAREGAGHGASEGPGKGSGSGMGGTSAAVFMACAPDPVGAGGRSCAQAEVMHKPIQRETSARRMLFPFAGILFARSDKGRIGATDIAQARPKGL